MASLQEIFPGCVISRCGDIDWPLWSCDLTPLHFFVGIRDRPIYADKRSTFEHLKTNIRQVMGEMLPNMRQKVVENYFKRTNACNTSHGGNLNDVVFHT